MDENYMSLNQLKVPILLLTFNRKDTTLEVFNSIKEVKPLRLYIASDGPRESKKGEREKVEEIREYILNNIDWNCEVKTLFREKNLSCGPSIYSAISWFFKHEEMGIILEDDTKPNKSFYYFCNELLEKYKNDTRIGMISGNNHSDFVSHGPSYLFSKFPWTWGWATWRRAWANMDFIMEWEKSIQRNDILINMGYKKTTVEHWENKINDVKTKRVNAWDYQWFLSLSSQNQLCIVPEKNLVSNIGFGKEATHTIGEAPKSYTETVTMSFPLNHPEYVVPYFEFEKKDEKKYNTFHPIKDLIPKPIKMVIKKLLGLKR